MNYSYANKILMAEPQDFLELLCRDALGESDIQKPLAEPSNCSATPWTEAIRTRRIRLPCKGYAENVRIPKPT